MELLDEVGCDHGEGREVPGFVFVAAMGDGVRSATTRRVRPAARQGLERIITVRAGEAGDGWL